MPRGVLNRTNLSDVLHINGVHHFDVVPEIIHIVDALILAVAERRVSLGHVIGGRLYF